MAKRTEKQAVRFLEKFYKYVGIPAAFAFTLFIVLFLAGMAVLAIVITKQIVLPIVTLVFLFVIVAITWLTYYGKRVEPLKAQHLLGLAYAMIPLSMAAVLAYVAVYGKVASIFLIYFFMIICLLFGIGILWINFKKKRAWFAAPSQLTFFEFAIPKSYNKRLIINEAVMVFIALVGVILKFVFNIPTFGDVLIFIGIAGALLAPIWVYIMPPTKFLKKRTQEELKGTVLPGEKFLGAIFGTIFYRPGAAAESTDNSLFITNKHIFVITISGLTFTDIRQTSPFYKAQAFNYLQKRGTPLLKKTPKKVLFFHPYNFSIPFERIRKVKLVSNFLFKILGFNAARIITDEGPYMFLIYYPDQFEKLGRLLKKAIPDKVVEKAFF